MGKVFYWIKVSEEYYKHPGIKKLILDGGTAGYLYHHYYQRLLIDAAKNEGYLYYEEYEDCFADEMALKHDWNYNDTRIAVALMMKARLIEQVDETSFFFPQVEEVVGSETESAVRMRRQRQKLEEKRHNVTQSCDNVTGSRNIVQKCDTEIDIESELEKETELHSEINIDSDEIYRGEYGNVKLLDKEYKRLIEKFPDDYRERIDRLSRYIHRTAKHYPSHYATIVRWANEDAARGKIPDADTNTGGSFDTESFFEAAVQRSYAGVK